MNDIIVQFLHSFLIVCLAVLLYAGVVNRLRWFVQPWRIDTLTRLNKLKLNNGITDDQRGTINHLDYFAYSQTAMIFVAGVMAKRLFLALISMLRRKGNSQELLMETETSDPVESEIDSLMTEIILCNLISSPITFIITIIEVFCFALLLSIFGRRVSFDISLFHPFQGSLHNSRV